MLLKRAVMNEWSDYVSLNVFVTSNTAPREQTLYLVDIRNLGVTGHRVSSPEGTFDGIGGLLRVCALLTACPVGLSTVRDPSKADIVVPRLMFGLCYFIALASWRGGVSRASDGAEWARALSFKTRLNVLQSAYVNGERIPWILQDLPSFIYLYEVSGVSLVA